MEKLINEFDVIVRWPKKPSDKEMVIEHLSTKFKYNKKYTEKEVNKIINTFHVFGDIPLLRRELVSRKFLARGDNGSVYWKIN